MHARAIFADTWQDVHNNGTTGSHSPAPGPCYKASIFLLTGPGAVGLGSHGRLQPYEMVQGWEPSGAGCNAHRHKPGQRLWA